MTVAGFEMLACPHCSAQYKKRIYASFGTYGAIFYSDGRISSAFIPESLSIIKCFNKACGKFFRINEAPVIGKLEDKDYRSPLWNSTFYLVNYKISAAELEEALEKGFCRSEEEELQSRTLLLIRYNDWVRTDRSLNFPPEVKAKFLANIEKLLELAPEEPTAISRMLFRAELYREKGDFDACIQTLRGLKIDDQNTLRKMQKIFSQAKVKDDRVANLGDVAIKKEYLCDHCGKSLIVFDLDKLDSPYAYRHYWCKNENKIFNAPSKKDNQKRADQHAFEEIKVPVKTPYERYLPREKVYCFSCSNIDTELFNPEQQKCIECHEGSYVPVKWFDEELEIKKCLTRQ
jgi:hypothetical protein